MTNEKMHRCNWCGKSTGWMIGEPEDWVKFPSDNPEKHPQYVCDKCISKFKKLFEYCMDDYVQKKVKA